MSSTFSSDQAAAWPSNWQADADLTSLTTLALPARARWLVDVQQEDELPAVLALAEKRDLPFMVLGGGSNVLFAHDYPGLVLHLQLGGVSSRRAGDHILVTAAAGENWHLFVSRCVSKGWYGLENLALIPGTVGAAPVQNIGAYGVELADRLASVRYLDLQRMQVEQLSAEQCEFGYRDSIFKHSLKHGAIILSCTFRLDSVPAPVLSYPALREALGAGPVIDQRVESGVGETVEAGDQVTPQQVFDAVCRVRRSKLPDPAVLGNAGSFFRNPVISREHYKQLLIRWPQLPCFELADGSNNVKVPAAWLIEQAGWKGVRRGAIGVHDKQALVLVHDFFSSSGSKGGSGGSDGPGSGDSASPGMALVELAADIAADVNGKFSILLEPEVQIEPASLWTAAIAAAGSMPHE